MQPRDEEELARTRERSGGDPASGSAASDHGGYAERGPGRGDHPGRGRGESRDPQDSDEGEHAERARWREDDPDETSDRREDDDGDAPPAA